MATMAAMMTVVRGNDRFCGRFLNVDSASAGQASSATLCSKLFHYFPNDKQTFAYN
jgi:hypothetical protein